MDRYVTGAMIRQMREERNLTQAQLAETLSVSAKTVSKWETGKGYPDITLLEPLAKALGLSLTELFTGISITNTNRSCSMLRARLHVCPICGNILFSTGEAVIQCHGLELPALSAEAPDGAHEIHVKPDADEYYVTVDHEMTKDHHISFLAAICDNSVQITKLYPEGPAEARFKISRTKFLCCYCVRDGLFRIKVNHGKIGLNPML